MSSIRQIVSAVTVVACATSANGVSAQVSPPQAQSSAIFPDTPIGKLGQTLIEVINSGDSGTRVAFVTDHVSEAAIKDVPVADRVEWLTRVAEQSGGLEVLEATGSQPLEIHVKTRRGNHWARIYAFTDPRQSDRLGDYGAVSGSRASCWSPKVNASSFTGPTDWRTAAGESRIGWTLSSILPP